MANTFTSFLARKQVRILAIGALCVVSSFSVGMQTTGNVQPFELIQAGSTLPGDIDGNGIVDMHDAEIVLEIAQGYIEPTPRQLEADPNNDGQLTVDDAHAHHVRGCSLSFLLFSVKQTFKPIWQCMRLALCAMIALHIAAPYSAMAQQSKDSLALRPHCEQGYSDGSDCPVFRALDPQTLYTSELKKGDTLDIDLVIQNPDQSEIVQVRSWLTYDPSILAGIELSINEKQFPLITPGEADFDKNSGYVKINVIAADTNKPKDALIRVARIRFTVLQPADAGTYIGFYDTGEDGHTTVLAQKNGSDTQLIAKGDELGSLHIPFARHSAADDLKPENESCERHTECQSKTCFEGACKASDFTMPVGSSCDRDAHCSTNMCRNDICSEKVGFETGALCTNDLECASKLCHQGVCTEQDEPTAPTSAPACESSDDCESGICMAGHCREPGSLVPVGGTCTVHEQCESNLCVGGSCKDADDKEAQRTAFQLLQVRNVRVTTEESSVYLAWEELQSAQLKAYNVYYGTKTGKYIQRKTIPSSSSNITIRNLPKGTQYFFAVRAVNKSDEESSFSNEVSINISEPDSSSAPLVASLFTDSPKEQPIAPEENIELPGETGAPSSLLLLVLASAVIGTMLAARRQMIAQPYTQS